MDAGILPSTAQPPPLFYCIASHNVAVRAGIINRHWAANSTSDNGSN